MNEEFFEKILNFMKESKYYRIAELISFLQDIEINQKILEYENIDKKDDRTWLKGKGEITQWDIDYDEEFPDMDIDIFLLNDENCYAIYEMVDENIKKINDFEYEVDLDEALIKLRTNG